MNREKQAQILKALAHPTRLNILKYSGIVDFRKNGNLRCYFLKEKDKIEKIILTLK
ncbi:MAG: hypothetical protein R6V00_07760 [Candidatus Aminicenantes bacterium]